MGKTPESGLFYSLLDSQETSPDLVPDNSCGWEPRSDADREWARKADGQAYAVQPATACETAFRHGHWIADRERVLAAMRAGNLPAARIDRFLACGANCVVEYSPSSERYRMRASYCHDRFCDACARSRGKKLRRQLEQWTDNRTIRFVTLTLRQTDQTCFEVLNHLLSSFVRLRAQNFWKSAVDGGVGVVEVTRGKKRDHWHVHLHVLVVGTWIDQIALSAGWEKASRGSFITDVFAVEDRERSLGYIAKYASKGWSETVLEDADALLECMLAMRGRRLLIPFGEWYNRPDDEPQDQPTDWKRIDRLGTIHRDAIRGEIWALTIFRALGFAAGGTDANPVFVGSEVEWGEPSIERSD
jgi:hypothetical protein